MATPTAINPDIHRVRDEAADILVETVSQCTCAECRSIRAGIAPENDLATRAIDADDDEDEMDAPVVTAHETRDQSASLLLRSVNACDCADCQALRSQFAMVFRADDEGDDETEDKDEEDEEPEEDEEEEEEPPPTKKTPPAKAKAKAKRADEPDVTRNTSVVEFANPVTDTTVFVPITRIDAEQREIEGVLSNEDVDTFGTVFDHEAMKRAVQTKWHGNVREQHDAKKAVGRGVRAIFDDDKKQTIIRARISKGAEDTWQKILDGTLSGFSIGASNPKTETRMIDGKPISTYVDFNLAEVSVVDAPSNPGAAKSGLTIYRAAAVGSDEMFSDALDASEDAPVARGFDSPTPLVPAPAPTPVAPVSAANRLQAAVDRATSEAPVIARADEPSLHPTAPTGHSMVVPHPLGMGISGQPVVEPTGTDYATIDVAMNGEHGAFAHIHAHGYRDGETHSNDHHHTHIDGMAHAHPHMHTHLGIGDGSKPHVHVHDHGHQYRVAASDLIRTQTGDYQTRGEAFIGEEDEAGVQAAIRRYHLRPDTTASAVTVVDLETPAALPMETSGTAQRTTSSSIAPAVVTAEVSRAGMRISGDTRTGLHEGVLSILRTCNCSVCQDAILCFDPDNDGDDDVDEDSDEDNDALPMGRAQQAKFTRAIRATIATQLQQQTHPILAQFRQVAARLATVSGGAQTPELTRMQSQLDEVRSVLTEVQGLVTRIAESEMPGGPVVRAMDKTLALDPAPMGTAFTSQDIATLHKAGLLRITTPDQQTQLAAQMIAQQSGLR